MSPSINKKLEDIKAMCSTRKRIIDPDRGYTTPLKQKKMEESFVKDFDVKSRQLEKHFTRK